jgi:hypothetical protein
MSKSASKTKHNFLAHLEFDIVIFNQGQAARLSCEIADGCAQLLPLKSSLRVRMRTGGHNTRQTQSSSWEMTHTQGNAWNGYHTQTAHEILVTPHSTVSTLTPHCPQ